ncbi:MAG: peptidylprolyl isomerase [Planctomycetes bacterium]|nr:peptidylprolyl isomerase [Planctomycetota bacterium]
MRTFLLVGSAALAWLAGVRGQEPSGPPPAWRSQIIGFEGGVAITLGEMVQSLEQLFLPDASRHFDSQYGSTLRGSEQVEHWIQGYLDYRALSGGLSADQLRSAREQAIADAQEIIAQRVEQRVAGAARSGAPAPFPPGVTAEAWAEHELRRYLTNEGFALLDRRLAELQIEAPTHGDVLRHYAEFPLRWDGGINASMLFLSYREPASGARLDAAGRAEVSKRAQALHQELVAGADFADLARRRSEHASTAPKGGAMDWLSYTSSPLPEEATAALFDTPSGNLSAPVPTRRGVFIFLVHERRARPSPPLAKIETLVSEDLRRERARRLILERRQKLRIDER